MLRDLNSILGYIERLNELDTSGVEPMAQVSARRAHDVEAGEAFAYAMRPDELIRACRMRTRSKQLLRPTVRSSRCRR